MPRQKASGCSPRRSRTSARGSKPVISNVEAATAHPGCCSSSARVRPRYLNSMLSGSTKRVPATNFDRGSLPSTSVTFHTGGEGQDSCHLIQDSAAYFSALRTTRSTGFQFRVLEVTGSDWTDERVDRTRGGAPGRRAARGRRAVRLASHTVSHCGDALRCTSRQSCQPSAHPEA
jgi:hypothetical protein